MTESSNTTTNKIDWRRLSEETGYRVLTLPSGETLASEDIAAVRLADDSVGTFGDVHSRRVIIDTKRMVAAFIVKEEPTDVFALATTAHRQWGGREG